MYHRQQLIGHWYRSEQQGDEHYSEFAQLRADGSFCFTFYVFQKDGTLVDEISEFGDWGVVGNIHFTITKSEQIAGKDYPADLENEDNYQAYRIVKLTENEFTYEHIVTGESYTLSRVQSD